MRPQKRKKKANDAKQPPVPSHHQADDGRSGLQAVTLYHARQRLSPASFATGFARQMVDKGGQIVDANVIMVLHQSDVKTNNIVIKEWII
ncbi:MAG: hypothetical protein IT551_12355 [Novosphingobium sp.]|nr:hypothetical protein [Novosphingobium sp.]